MRRGCHKGLGMGMPETRDAHITVTLARKSEKAEEQQGLKTKLSFSGGFRGGARPTSFSDQTEARRA